MSHVSESTLRSFVAGDLDEAEAVQVALHIDECVSCANRAIAFEPLAPAFAAVEDPVVPDDFKTAVIAELDRRGPPMLELSVGLGLLLAAASLIFFVDGPVHPVVDSFTVAHAAGSVAERFVASLSTGEQAAIVLLALIGTIATIRLATGTISSLFGSDRRTA